MFLQGPSPAPRPLPVNGPAPVEDGGMYFVDFGAAFAEEVSKVLRYRQGGMLCEIVFWHEDEYRF